MGRDLAKLGRKLVTQECHFWGTNFIRFSEVVKLYEQKTKNPMALPIFGGLIQKHATKRGDSDKLSVFKDGLINAIIFKHFKVVGDLFHLHQDLPGRVNTN